MSVIERLPLATKVAAQSLVSQSAQRWVYLARLCNCSGDADVGTFLELSYGYLPFVLGASLAHYLRLGMTEAGRFYKG